MTRSTLRRSERLSTILGRLAADGSIDAARLAAAFGVSPATIRRDLQTLKEQKLLSRTHGGAVAGTVTYELPVAYRGGRHRQTKQAIARCAAARLPHGPLTVGFTGGTTTYEVARIVARRFDLTVVTNALNIGFELALRPRLKLIMTGGVSRTRSYELVGPLADTALADLDIGVAVVGVDAISAGGGLTTHDHIEAHTNATMIARARRVIVVADGSKIGQVLAARICPVTAVSELITDESADVAAVDAIRRAGVEVTIART